MLADAAGHNPLIVAEIRADVQRYAVEADPAPEPDADGGYFVFLSGETAMTAPVDPDPDATVPAFTVYAKARQGNDHPFLQVPNELAYVAPALVQVQHDVSDPLAGAMIGKFTSATRLENGESVRVE